MAHSDHSHTPVQTPVTGIIGASGKTGARINQALRAAGIMTRPLSRQADIPFDWADRSGWPQALAGLDSLYITYAPDLAVPAAEDDIRHLTELARTSGIRHLVLLSGRGEEGAQRAEAQVRNSGLNWNIVRASWFMQNFSESFMLDGVLARQVVLPEVSVTEPFIDVDDIAAVAVAVLTRPELSQQVLEVTGPELLSFAQCVETISDAVGEPVAYIPVPLEAYLAGMAEQGAPEDMLWLMNELFSEVLDGRNEQTTNTVADILGRPATSFREYAEKTARRGVWSTKKSTNENESEKGDVA